LHITQVRLLFFFVSEDLRHDDEERGVEALLPWYPCEPPEDSRLDDGVRVVQLLFWYPFELWAEVRELEDDL